MKTVVALLEEVGNFGVFDFGPYAKIENLEIVSRLVVFLLEKVGNFRGFRVFDFGTYPKAENSEIVSRLVKLIDFFFFFG